MNEEDPEKARKWEVGGIESVGGGWSVIVFCPKLQPLTGCFPVDKKERFWRKVSQNGCQTFRMNSIVGLFTVFNSDINYYSIAL